MNDIACNRCGSKNSIKTGILHEIQKYSCKNCGKNFLATYKNNQVNYKYKNINDFCFDDDLWDLRTLGLYKDELDAKHTHLDFSLISQPWLRIAIKKYIQLKLNSGYAVITVKKTVELFSVFSNYLKAKIIDDEECITRNIILDFVFFKTQGKSKGYTSYCLTQLQKFTNCAVEFKWLNLPLHLVRKDDHPKYKRGETNDIPRVVFDQINENLHKLPDQIACMWMLAYFCGMRISEIRLCAIDCLKQDSRGQWSITFWRKKSKNYHTLPVSRELALVIQEQQAYIKEWFGNDFKYLFCGKTGRIIHTEFLKDPINKLLTHEGIKDENGELWYFTNHQLRDTRATYLFETGHEFAVVSKWLGHKHMLTTQKYVHVSNDTLRKETAKVQAQLTNIKGELIAPQDLPKTLLKNPSSHTLAVPENHINTPIYGYCGLPLDEDCFQWKACYTCPSFVATRELLPDYIRFRDKLRAKLARAVENGESVKVDQFKQQADSLDVIIARFEGVA